MTGSRASFPTHLPSLPGWVFALKFNETSPFFAMRDWQQGLLPFSSQEMRPRQLLSLLDKEKAQQP